MTEAISIGAIVIFIMLILYMVMGTCIESYHLSFGHEASFIILIGKFSILKFNSCFYRHDDLPYWLYVKR